MKYVFVLTLICFTFDSYASDVCSQLRTGLHEIENEEHQLCSEYIGTCAFLETAKEQLASCKGDDCNADIAITLGGCALVVGWDNCKYVGERFTSFKERRQQIVQLANERDCLLF